MERRTGSRTEKDMSAYVRSSLRGLWGGNWKSWRVWVGALQPYALAILISTALYFINGPQIQLIEAYIAGGVSGAFAAYIGNCVIGPHLRKKMNIQNGPFIGELTVEWDENLITTRCNDVSYSASWEAVRSVVQINDTLILQTDVAEGVVIPASTFSSENDLQAFKNYVQSRIAANSEQHSD